MRHQTLPAAFALAVTLAAPLCAADPGISESEIRLGMVNAQSGAASGLGHGMRTGAEAVFKDVNAKGGVNGRQITLLVDDDAYDPNKSIDATLKMIEEQKVFSLFGYVGTPTANAVLPIVKENKVPLVGVFTGAMSLRQPVVPQVINIRASYDDEAEMLVDHLVKDKGAKRFAVFHQDDGFGQAVLSGTEKALKKRGMEVVAKGSFQRGTVAVKTGLAAVMAANPDAVVMVGPYTPLAEFIKAAREAGLKADLATVSFVGTNDLVKLVGTAGDGVVISQVVPFPDDTGVPLAKDCAALVEKYAPGEKLGFVSMEGCVTAKAMVLALRKAGAAPTRDGLIAAFESFRGEDLGGMTLSLASDNHQGSTAVYLTQFQGGKITPVSTLAH